MIEKVVELRPQFEELRFPNGHSLKNIEVPVILAGSPQGVPAQTTATSRARQQSDVLRARWANTRTPSVGIRIERRANRHATWIDCGRGDCRCGAADGCWSLFGSQTQGPDALLRILRALLPVANGKIRLDVASLGLDSR